MEVTKFSPELELNHEARAQIAHTLATPGFLQINRIMRAEVDKFILDLINVPEDDDKSVVAKHKLSKAAAQYYQRVVNRINAEAQQFMRDASAGAAPEDPTEGIIDIGPSASTAEDLLEGFELNPHLLEEELQDE